MKWYHKYKAKNVSDLKLSCIGKTTNRYDKLIQRSFYNSWKSKHGLKYQTIDNAFGIIMDLYGPMSLWRHDLVLLRESKINEKVSNIHINNNLLLFI